MQTIEMTSEAVLAAASVLPEDVPIIMLNLLRYREHAEYGERTDVAPCSGREAYFQHYIPAFNKIASANSITTNIFYYGTVLASLVAPADEPWDDVALVEYPSFAAFRRIAESREYAVEAAHHRRAALENWRLVATIKTPTS